MTCWHPVIFSIATNSVVFAKMKKNIISARILPLLLLVAALNSATLVSGLQDAQAQQMCSVQTLPRSSQRIATFMFKRDCPDSSHHDCRVLNNGSWQCTTRAVSNSDASRVSVIGSAIVLPDDGWYQIQNTIDYSTLHEGFGGRNHVVPDGTYHVINLTKNIRTDFLVVSTGATLPTPRTTPPPRAQLPLPAAPPPRAAPPPPSGYSAIQPICEISTVKSNKQITNNNHTDRPFSHGYSRRQAVNADETKLLLISKATYVYDIVNGQVTNPRSINITSEVMWSESDPNVLYGIQAGTGFVSLDLSTDRYTTYYDFEDAGVDTNHRFTVGAHEGHVQKDRYVVLRLTSSSRGTDKLIALDFSTRSTRVLGEMQTPANFDWASFSPDGKTIVIDGSGRRDFYSVHEPDFSYLHGPKTPPGNGEFRLAHSDWVAMENGDNVLVIATDQHQSIHNPRNDTWTLIGTQPDINGISSSGHISGLASKQLPGLYLASDTRPNQDSYIVKLTSSPSQTIDWFINIGQIWGGTSKYRDQTKGTISPTGKYITYNKVVNGQAQTFLMSMDNSRCPSVRR